MRNTALEQIGARPQMRLGAQIFHRMALLLQRVGRIAQAHNFHFLGLDFKGLLHFRRQRQHALHPQGAAQGGLHHFFEVGRLSSQTTCTFLKKLPSLISIKAKALLSRSVRTQPEISTGAPSGGRFPKKLSNQILHFLSPPGF